MRSRTKVASGIVAVMVFCGISMGGTVLLQNQAQWLDINSDPIGQWDWVVAVFNASYTPGATPVVTLDTGSFWSGNGVYSGSFTSSGGFTGYAVVFNSDAIITASYYAQVNLTGEPISSIPDPDDQYEWQPGAIEGSWTQVPEPGTMALFGLGIAAMAVRNRFKK